METYPGERGLRPRTTQSCPPTMQRAQVLSVSANVHFIYTSWSMTTIHPEQAAGLP